MARKRTKREALDRLEEKREELGDDAGKITRASFGLAKGLIMLDPLNRLADERIVLPLDMVCIPAYQAYMIQGNPSMQIYVRAGETIIPTGGNVRDVEEGMVEAESIEVAATPNPKKKKTTRQRAYSKNFKKIAPRYKLKNGKWKKDGFKRCVKEAHRMCK